MKMTQKDKDFLWSLMPEWVKEVPSDSHGWDPMWFGTLSRTGDIEVHERVCKLLNQKTRINTDEEKVNSRKSTQHKK